MADYSSIDQSPLIGFLFYPRRDFSPCPQGALIFSSPLPRTFRSRPDFMKETKAGPGFCIFMGMEKW